MTNTATKPRAALRQLAHRIQQDYAGDQDRPLGGYTVVMGVYTAVLGALTALGRLRGARVPDRFGVQDTVLLCVATHKASRLLTKDAVTSPLRAPFTRYEEPAGEGEVNESVRGTGAQHALGELLSCPFCLAVWISGGLTAGLVLAPPGHPPRHDGTDRGRRVRRHPAPLRPRQAELTAACHPDAACSASPSGRTCPARRSGRGAGTR